MISLLGMKLSLQRGRVSQKEDVHVIDQGLLNRKNVIAAKTLAHDHLIFYPILFATRHARNLSFAKLQLSYTR